MQGASLGTILIQCPIILVGYPGKSCQSTPLSLLAPKFESTGINSSQRENATNPTCLLTTRSMACSPVKASLQKKGRQRKKKKDREKVKRDKLTSSHSAALTLTAPAGVSGCSIADKENTQLQSCNLDPVSMEITCETASKSYPSMEHPSEVPELLLVSYDVYDICCTNCIAINMH